MKGRLGIALAAVALSLSGCAGLAALTSGVPVAPQEIADRTVLDEKAGTAVETLYTAATRAGALAFRAGIVKPSSNPAVQLDNFCALVKAKAFEPTDRGSSIMAMECKLRAARDAVRTAYDASNAKSYSEAIGRASSLGNELLALITGE